MKNNTNTTNNTIKNMEVNTMNIKDLLLKGTIDTIEEYEFFKNEAGEAYVDDCGNYTIKDLRIEFNGGFAEIYEVDEDEDVTQNIRFYNDIDGQVDTYEEAYELTGSEILEKYEDEILEELEYICKQIYREGYNNTYTLYYDRRNENFWIMEHTGNSYSGDKHDVALGSYDFQYADASSDVELWVFFDYLKSTYNIDIAEVQEPTCDNEDEELEKAYEEYSEQLEELQDQYWDEYIDYLIEGFCSEWVSAEFDNLEMRYK